ncbi:MAG TPA: hypothetical protein VGT02_15465 [Methylomirabilota bacterium]|jgi:hypothetical protein|nr:hypothetical protein [Methylomirabilota bacterium]
MKRAIALGLCLTALFGMFAANQLAAQTTTTPITPAVTPTTPTTATPTVLNIVEITRSVPSGTTPVSAFTVPAGQTLIVTDVLVTNTGLAPACGAAITRAGGAAAPVTGAVAPGGTPGAPTGAVTTASAVAGTLTQSDSTITGPLCVGAQTTTAVPLTTGIEFGPGQAVQLLNVPDATTTAGVTPAATAGAIAFHLRGMLVAS